MCTYLHIYNVALAVLELTLESCLPLFLNIFSWVWWPMPLIPALGRQVDLCTKQVQDSQGSLTQRNSVLKTKQTKISLCYMYLSVGMCTCGVYRGQKLFNPLVLELQVVVCCQMWVLKTKFWSSVRAISIFNCSHLFCLRELIFKHS